MFVLYSSCFYFHILYALRVRNKMMMMMIIIMIIIIIGLSDEHSISNLHLAETW